MAVLVDPSSAERRHDHAEQVHNEQPAQRRGAEIVRRRGEMERHVREHGDVREQHAEPERIGRDQLTVAKQFACRSAEALFVFRLV